MTAQRKDPDRKVVPRFGTLIDAASRGETLPTSRRPDSALLTDPRSDATIAQLRRDWEANRTTPYAADFVSASLVDGSLSDAQEAAEFLIENTSDPIALTVARRVLGESTPDAPEEDFDADHGRAIVRALKSSVRLDPRAALHWIELARVYASLGQRNKAADAMRIALALAPENRVVLRSAARLNLHLDDPERGHDLLLHASNSRSDPWLVAAEVAMAPLAGRQPQLVKIGRRLLESRRFTDRAVSELASALATEEMSAGKAKRARRLFAASLDDATENAVAQATWAHRHGGAVAVTADVLAGVEGSYEARAYVTAESGDSKAAIENAWRWSRAEPFASNPPTFGSHEAALARDYEQAVRFAEFGLLANSDDFLLRNNLVFALASAGRVAEATEQFARIEKAALQPEQASIVRATEGLLAFRQGNVSQGRTLYRKVMAEAPDPALRAVASLMLIREELLAHSPTNEALDLAVPVFAESVRRIGDPRGKRIDSWLRHLEDETGVKLSP